MEIFIEVIFGFAYIFGCMMIFAVILYLTFGLAYYAIRAAGIGILEWLLPYTFDEDELRWKHTPPEKRPLP